MELADALLENNSVRYLELKTERYNKSSAEAMAMFLRTSKRLQQVRWVRDSEKSRWVRDSGGECQRREEMLCYFLPAFQESTSLKKLDMNFPLTIGEPSNLALENC
jgi:hypothetical protein